MRQILLAGQPTVNERRLLLNYITLSTGNWQDYKVCFLDHSCCIFFMFQLYELYACMLTFAGSKLAHCASGKHWQVWKYEHGRDQRFTMWVKCVATSEPTARSVGALKDYDLCVVVKIKETVCKSFTAIFLALHIGISESRESCELTWLLLNPDWIS